MEVSGFFRHTKNNNLMDRAPNLVHQGRLDNRIISTKLTTSSRVVEKNEHKIEILQVDKINSLCCFSQIRAHELKRRCFTQTSA